MENENKLKQADAFVRVEGILAEKNLEATKDKNGGDIIRGDITVKVDDTHSVVLNVYVGALTSKGAENPAYKGMNTVLNEYHSIAEVGEEAATRVRCNRGSLQPNTFIDRNGDVRTNIRYSASFLTRVDETSKTPYYPHAEFEVEGYIKTITEEKDKEGEDTGRLKVSILVPTYNSIEPMDIMIPVDMANDFGNIFEPGETFRAYGVLENNVIVKEREVKMALGAPRIEKDYTYIDERILTGGSEPYPEETAYSSEAIRKALTDREMRIEEMKANASNKTATIAKPTAVKANGGRPLPRF